MTAAVRAPRFELMRALYSALMVLLRPVYLARLWWRGRAEPMYRHAIQERMGYYGSSPTQGLVWVHAVSLGETHAAAALVAALRRQRPGLRLLLTHGTATGREAGRALLEPDDLQCWLPYDAPGAVRRFFDHFRPAIGILMETEIWPNLLAGAEAARVPMVLANARLSPKSYARGRQLSGVMDAAARRIALVLAQSGLDAVRLRASGASSVEVFGNLKFDVTPDAAQLARGRAWREASERPVVLAASTREGEEAMLLGAWRALDPAARPRLLVVPRHPQRFNAVAALIEQAGYSLARRSAWADAPDAQARTADVWLGDSLGEMALYYGLADVALLGGSFAPLGGQNLIEAAACGCPVVMGPHTFNFAQASALAQEAGAALREPDLSAAVARAVAMLGDGTRARCAERALAFAASHRGAADRMARRILALVPAGSAADDPASMI